MAIPRNAAALALKTNTTPTMPKSWPFYVHQPETTTMTDPATTTGQATPSQAEAPDALTAEDALPAVFEILQRIEAKLDTIFDVLAADEDEEIQLTLDDKDKRVSEQGKGLG